MPADSAMPATFISIPSTLVITDQKAMGTSLSRLSLEEKCLMKMLMRSPAQNEKLMQEKHLPDPNTVTWNDVSEENPLNQSLLKRHIVKNNQYRQFNAPLQQTRRPITVIKWGSETGMH